MFESSKSQKNISILIKKYVSTNEKKIYQKNYFINLMVIQNSVLKVILGQGIPFVYPNCECTQLLLFIL